MSSIHSSIIGAARRRGIAAGNPFWGTCGRAVQRRRRRRRHSAKPGPARNGAELAGTDARGVACGAVCGGAGGAGCAREGGSDNGRVGTGGAGCGGPAPRRRRGFAGRRGRGAGSAPWSAPACRQEVDQAPAHDDQAAKDDDPQEAADDDEATADDREGPGDDEEDSCPRDRGRCSAVPVPTTASATHVTPGPAAPDDNPDRTHPAYDRPAPAPPSSTTNHLEGSTYVHPHSYHHKDPDADDLKHHLAKKVRPPCDRPAPLLPHGPQPQARRPAVPPRIQPLHRLGALLPQRRGQPQSIGRRRAAPPRRRRAARRAGTGAGGLAAPPRQRIQPREGQSAPRLAVVPGRRTQPPPPGKQGAPLRALHLAAAGAGPAAAAIRHARGDVPQANAGQGPGRVRGQRGVLGHGGAREHGAGQEQGEARGWAARRKHLPRLLRGPRVLLRLVPVLRGRLRPPRRRGDDRALGRHLRGVHTLHGRAPGGKRVRDLLSRQQGHFQGGEAGDLGGGDQAARVQPRRGPDHVCALPRLARMVHWPRLRRHRLDPAPLSPPRRHALRRSRRRRGRVGGRRHGQRLLARPQFLGAGVVRRGVLPDRLRRRRVRGGGGAGVPLGAAGGGLRGGGDGAVRGRELRRYPGGVPRGEGGVCGRDGAVPRGRAMCGVDRRVLLDVPGRRGAVLGRRVRRGPPLVRGRRVPAEPELHGAGAVHVPGRDVQERQEVLPTVPGFRIGGVRARRVVLAERGRVPQLRRDQPDWLRGRHLQHDHGLLPCNLRDGGPVYVSEPAVQGDARAVRRVRGRWSGDVLRRLVRAGRGPLPDLRVAGQGRLPFRAVHQDLRCGVGALPFRAGIVRGRGARDVPRGRRMRGAAGQMPRQDVRRGPEPRQLRRRGVRGAARGLQGVRGERGGVELREVRVGHVRGRGVRAGGGGLRAGADVRELPDGDMPGRALRVFGGAVPLAWPGCEARDAKRGVNRSFSGAASEGRRSHPQTRI